MAQLADLLDALERTGDQPGRPVSAHLDPALNEVAKAAVALGLAESVSALTGAALHAELRRLALRAVLDAHYARRPDDRPHVAEVALFLAKARKLPFAERADLLAVLRLLAEAMGTDATAAPPPSPPLTSVTSNAFSTLRTIPTREPPLPFKPCETAEHRWW